VKLQSLEATKAFMIERGKEERGEASRKCGEERNRQSPLGERHAREAIRERKAEPEKPAPAETARGTLAGGNREKEQPRRHAANDNLPRAEIMALAAMLQKQEGDEREAPANDNEAVKERMLAFGFDPAKPATLAKWQELGGQVDAGRITEKDRLREMAQYLWHEADKEHRAGHQPQQPGARERQQELDRDR